VTLRARVSRGVGAESLAGGAMKTRTTQLSPTTARANQPARADDFIDSIRTWRTLRILAACGLKVSP